MPYRDKAERIAFERDHEHDYRKILEGVMVTKIIAAPWGAKYTVRTFSQLVRDHVEWTAIEHVFGHHRAIGRGASEAQAVSDLLEQLQRRQSFDWTPPEVA